MVQGLCPSCVCSILGEGFQVEGLWFGVSGPGFRICLKFAV